MTIVEFLEARLADDEQRCARFPGGIYRIIHLDERYDPTAEEQVQQYLHRFQPDWMVLDLAAKRATIIRHTGAHECWPGGGVIKGAARGDDVDREPCRDIKDLAAIYRDHPDYRQEWKP